VLKYLLRIFLENPGNLLDFCFYDLLDAM